MEAETKGKKKPRVIIVVVLVALLLIVGIVWNDVTTRQEEALFTPYGEMVEVYDTKMHVFSVGERKANEPAIVMISGLGTPSPAADFFPLWNSLSKEHFVVVLERPGYGWSKNTSRERTTQNILEESQLALAQTGIEPPYLLVAHDMGGMEASLYASQYPDEVAGLVLLDCNAPQLMLSKGEQALSFGQKMMPLARTLGILRLLGTISPGTIDKMSWSARNNFEYVSQYYRDIDRHFAITKYYGSMMQREAGLRMANAETVSATSFPADLPVALILYDKEEFHQEPDYESNMAMQQSWVDQSTKGAIHLMDGGHYIHQYQPDEINKIIEDLLQQNAG